MGPRLVTEISGDKQGKGETTGGAYAFCFNCMPLRESSIALEMYEKKLSATWMGRRTGPFHFRPSCDNIDNDIVYSQ